MDHLLILAQTTVGILGDILGATPSPAATPAAKGVLDTIKDWSAALVAVAGVITTVISWRLGARKAQQDKVTFDLAVAKAAREQTAEERAREQYPRADVTHGIISFDSGAGALILRVTIKISNTGKSQLSIPYVLLRVQQIKPLHPLIVSAIRAQEDPVIPGEREIGYPPLKEKEFEKGDSPTEIESGEKDELTFDFVISADLELVKVYTYVRNTSMKKEIGWNTTSIYDTTQGKIIDPFGSSPKAGALAAGAKHEGDK